MMGKRVCAFAGGATIAMLGASATLFGADDKYQPRTPAEVVGLKDQARALLKSGRDSDAIEMLELAVAKKPDYYLGHLNLGIAYLVVDDKKNAQRSLERAKEIAIENEFRDPSVFNTLGWFYLQNEEPLKAVPLFERAIDIDPRYARSYNNLGVALEALGRIQEAGEAYQRAREYGKGHVSKNAQRNLKRLKEWTAVQRSD